MSGQKVRNMEEFATLIGLSRPTLSKFFNDPQSVRQSTRERINAALDRYDYTPNIYAINQNRRLTRNIGIVVPYLADPFFAEVARLLEPLCAGSGFNPILLSSNGDPDREIENLDSLKSIKPAGSACTVGPPLTTRRPGIFLRQHPHRAVRLRDRRRG
jgi:DNA-binding LacI/PurR family transcriptional regulator